jgi:dCMP deaminase
VTNPLNSERLQTWAVDMARHVAKLSKDPSTQVGAVIFDPKRRIVSAGYNGFARGVPDDPGLLQNRDVKYRLIVHAEKNALLFATAPLEGCTLVVTHPCCAQCAALVVQAGIKHVLWPTPSAEFLARWYDDMKLSRMQFASAGITVTAVPQ